MRDFRVNGENFYSAAENCEMTVSPVPRGKSFHSLRLSGPVVLSVEKFIPRYDAREDVTRATRDASVENSQSEEETIERCSLDPRLKFKRGRPIFLVVISRLFRLFLTVRDKLYLPQKTRVLFTPRSLDRFARNRRTDRNYRRV